MPSAPYTAEYFEGRIRRGGENIANEFFREFLLRQSPARGSLLEIGCAKGEFLKLVEPDFDRLVGVDVSEYAIAKSRDHLRKARTYVWDAESGNTAPFLSDPFEVIASMHTFEHFRNPAAVLRALRPLLAPHGVMVILVPNPRAWKLRLARAVGLDRPGSILFDPTHHSFHDRATWAGILHAAGFDVRWAGRPFFYLKKRWLKRLYRDRYYGTGRASETGPELVFVCRHRAGAGATP